MAALALKSGNNAMPKPANAASRSASLLLAAKRLWTGTLTRSGEAPTLIGAKLQAAVSPGRG